MDGVLDVVSSITNNLFNEVAILIGLIALIGLALQRKPVEEVVSGTLRATIGVVILNIGVGVFVEGLVGFQAIVSSAMGVEAPTSSSTLAEFSAGAGTAVPLIIAGGFVVHLLIVRFFKAARYVYLTGHLMYWMAVVIAASLVQAFTDVSRWTLAGVGALIIACYWALQPLWTQPLMRKVMGDDEVALAHTTSTLALAAGYGSKALKLGDPVKDSSENLKLPKGLSFFKDINVSTASVIGIIMLVAIGFADSVVVEEQMAGADILPWVWGLLTALKFAAGIAILLFGVRMFLAEIVPAFRGLSEKVLPGAKPALDIPVTFTKAPTAVILGFLASTVVFLILMGIFAAAGWFVLVPPMIMLFFGGGAGGVFGNAVAGWKGAVFGGVLNGLMLGFGQWISWNMYSDTAPELATLADPDWFAVGWIVVGFGSIVEPLGAWAIWIVAAAVVALTIVILTVVGRRQPDAEDIPAPAPAPVAVGAHVTAETTVDSASAPATAAATPSAEGTASRPDTITVLAVCGVGMGTSLILRTTTEKALKELGVEATLSHTDVGTARGQKVDVVVAQPTYLEELGDMARVMVPIEHFTNLAHVKERIVDALKEEGWY